MTWDHPRAYDPLLACDAVWRARTGVSVQWDRRSLQDFETYPIEQLARRYDLLVIDHPHVGLVAEQGCLVAFEQGVDAVGPSLASYRWNGRLWALPIDAATQVQCIHRDRLGAPPTEWAAVLELAHAGKVLVPLRSPHALMCFMTLAANTGHPCGATPDVFVEPEIGADVLDQLRQLSSLMDEACFGMDPIAVYERMSEPGHAACCAPLIYGYVSYARAKFRGSKLAFSGIALPEQRGATLGGTGIAVSSRSAAVEAARWIAGPEAQTGPYAASGGQPAHVDAWNDARLDADCGGFFSATRTTVDQSYVRPRDAGYMAFQQRASTRVSAALRDGDTNGAVGDLNAMFAAR